MQLHAEYVRGGGHVRETIQKEGLRDQLNNVTNCKVRILSWIQDKANK